MVEGCNIPRGLAGGSTVAIVIAMSWMNVDEDASVV